MRILVVCLGNICRSPLAEVVLRTELRAAGVGDRVTVDSAGTGDWNLGKPPDPRMRDAAAAAGVTLDGTARQIAERDLAEADLILVMDRHNLADVHALAPDRGTREKVQLFLAFAGQAETDVPDPYNGTVDDYAGVVALVRPAAREIARRVAADLAPSSSAGPG